MTGDVLASLMISVMVCAGCAPADTDQADAAPAAHEQADTGRVAMVVNDIPEDSVIFRTTMDWVAANSADTLGIGELTAAIGQRFVGAPYTPGLLEVPPDEQLVINLREFDCVTFVEQMLAMARTAYAAQPTYAEFARQLRTIRYRDGELNGYPSRLHYFSEWIANNDAKGIVENVTQALGGGVDAEPISFMTTHVDAYRQLADTSVLEQIRQMEQRLSDVPRYFIPEAGVAGVADQIRNGDVIAATSTREGLDIAHTGLALWVDGQLHLMHAPLVGSVVEISEVSLAERILDISAQDGIMVARPQQP